MADTAVAFQGWNASGVGWGEDPWGESLADLPTGTGEVGSVTVTGTSVTTVTGLQATGQVGSVMVEEGTDVSVTGVQATGQVGSVRIVIWSLVDDNQTPSWQNVNSTQSPGWVVVNDANTATWTQITP